jgi:large subunit ribosomal protein L10
MARPDKAAAVAELTEAFRGSTAAVLTEYRGLSVAQLKELRRSLAGNATYSVVKNTLTKIAAREAGFGSFDSLLEGPSAIAFVTGDPVEVAKGLRNFGREHPSLIVKGGMLDGRPLSADEVRTLADLESREVLLAKFAGGLLAPAQQLATVLSAPAAGLARALGALLAKATEDPSLLSGGDGASATDPTPADQPAAAEPEAAATPEPEPETAAAAEPEPEPEPATEPAAAATTDSPTDETPTDGVADASSAS